MKTTSIRAEEITHSWYLVDADNQILGRLASKVAQILRGKNKPYFTPHMDMGDFVVIINAEKVKKNILNNTRAGSIILLHNNQQSFKNLQPILAETIQILQEKGFSFSVTW